MSKPRPAVKVCCSRCGGSGAVELTGVLAETLAALRDHPAEINGANFARLLGVEPTAMNNRLAGLERLGLVTRRAFGRESFWTATATEKREGRGNGEKSREESKGEGREKRRRCEA